MAKTATLREYLVSQNIPVELIEAVTKFRTKNHIENMYMERVVPPISLYYGEKVLTQSIVAILSGQHIIFEGDKASGKNVLAETLAFCFGRPRWNVSCHVHLDNSTLIGADTFRNGQVEFRKGHITSAMEAGGFVILDEINFARPEVLSVLYAATDLRREMDVEGYKKIKGSEFYRAIGTMNYGYTGTRDLNEAFADRFAVIHVDNLTEEKLTEYLINKFKSANPDILKFFSKIFIDLQNKAKNSEISSRSVSLRGILDALKSIQTGLDVMWSLEMSMINKCFDMFEKQKVMDTIKTVIDPAWERDVIFPTKGTTIVVPDFSAVKTKTKKGEK